MAIEKGGDVAQEVTNALEGLADAAWNLQLNEEFGALRATIEDAPAAWSTMLRDVFRLGWIACYRQVVK